MNENDLRDLLPDERSLPPSHRRDMKERLMVQIQKEEKATRNQYRLIVGVAAAGLAMVGAAALVAGDDDSEPPVIGPGSANRETPDPDEVERATRGSGIDYGIDAERIDCFTLDPPQDWSSAPEDGWHTIGVDPTVGTEPSIGSDPVTVEQIAGVCVSVLQGYLGEPAATYAFEVCVKDAEWPTAVVALAGATCGDADAHEPLDGEVRPITEADVAELNHMRAVEYALLAPREECPTAGQVEAWVDRVLQEEGLDLEVTVDTGGIPEPPDGESPAPECPRYAHVDWGAGTVSIEPFRS